MKSFMFKILLSGILMLSLIPVVHAQMGGLSGGGSFDLNNDIGPVSGDSLYGYEASADPYGLGDYAEEGVNEKYGQKDYGYGDDNNPYSPSGYVDADSNQSK